MADDKHKTGEQLIEEGVGLIAKGMFRESEGGRPREAFDGGMAAVSTIREMAFDFGRKAGIFTEETEKG